MTKHCTMRLKNFKTDTIKELHKKYLRFWEEWANPYCWLGHDARTRKLARRNKIRANRCWCELYMRQNEADRMELREYLKSIGLSSYLINEYMKEHE